MCGCTNNNFQPCTILLIIVILKNQGLLGDCPSSKNALTLIFLYWLCGMNKGCGNNNFGQMQNSQCCNPCCNPCCCQCKCKCKDKCKCKEKECKCKRVKLCCV